MTTTRRRWVGAILATIGVLLAGEHAGPRGRSGSAWADDAKGADLQEAIRARTEAIVRQREAGDLDADVLRAMRKTRATADSKQVEGNVLLTKDRYGESVAAFHEATRLYGLVVDGRKLLERLAKAQQYVTVARLLVEATARPDAVAEADRLRIDVKGYVEAGELEGAVAQLVKARAALRGDPSPDPRGAGHGSAHAGRGVPLDDLD